MRPILPRRRDHSLRTIKLLVHRAKQGGRDLRAGQHRLHIIAVGEGYVAVVRNVASSFDGTAAGAVCLRGVTVQEPVQDIDSVAIGLHDDVAEPVPPDGPLAHLLVEIARGRQRRFTVCPLDPVRVRHLDLADPALGDQLSRLLIALPVTLLEAEDDIQLSIGGLRGPDHTLAALYIHAGRLLDINVFAGLHGSLEMFRVKEYRRGDDHRIHVARQQLAVVLVDLRILQRDAFLDAFDAVVENVAEGNQPRIFDVHQQAGVERAAATRTDQPDSDRRVRRRPPRPGQGQQGGGLHQAPPRNLRLHGISQRQVH